MSNIDGILNSIITSTRSSNLAVQDLIKQESTTEVPDFIKSLQQKSNSTSELEGISLLSLKNQSLASYINNLALIVLGNLNKLDHDDSDSLKDEAINRSIVQRVTLEKGVKPLEKKLNYQIENLLKAYNKECESIQRKQENAEEDGEKDNNQEADLEVDSEDEEDELAFRPDATALAKLAPNSSKDSNTNLSGKYKPPKISAIAPPSSNKDSTEKSEKNQKLQSMEEYLQEQSEIPMAEASIGSTIVGHGRGGVKTQHDRKKEQEIQNYEESNFTRLPTTQTKKNFKQKQRDLANQFAGEDWSMFNGNNDKNLSSSTSRKRKAKTSWDRAKKNRF
ncbi:uncharacterized protein KGF55_000067 [Candida pseudojiufengensis]|uniref:uncharacterized protein n=1 Tax=Candida pseudojiufengensis TaxID=497109 RepID=UPI00222585EC|nr:uncharacterized protein KGF55_000067 [Candida pseudojiufengensis]KAI5967835.1 hypothetical protein KGF55_000067 [Candida pseudojiufengensis]